MTTCGSIAWNHSPRHATFGDTGAYERVIGIARGELDPADPRNQLIVGIDRAPRNAAGMVEYETDLFILRPVDPAKGNHQLLFDVLNRGNKVVTNRAEPDHAGR